MRSVHLEYFNYGLNFCYFLNYRQARAAVWSRSMDTKKEGDTLGNNRNENVEADQGCDTKGQRVERQN